MDFRDYYTKKHLTISAFYGIINLSHSTFYGGEKKNEKNIDFYAGYGASLALFCNRL